jgi:hypothetical protein
LQAPLLLLLLLLPLLCLTPAAERCVSADLRAACRPTGCCLFRGACLKQHEQQAPLQWQPPAAWREEVLLLQVPRHLQQQQQQQSQLSRHLLPLL